MGATRPPLDEESLEQLAGTITSYQDQHLQDAFRDTDRDRFLREAQRDTAERSWSVKAGLWILVGLLAGGAVWTAATWSRTVKLAIGAAPKASTDAWLAATEQPLSVQFPNNVRYILAVGSRGRLARPVGSAPILTLELGSVEASVPTTEQNWALLAGALQVRTRGANYSAVWEPAKQKFEIKVKDGQVEIEGAQLNKQRLVSGEHLSVELSTGTP